jgi:hypothetical protein
MTSVSPNSKRLPVWVHALAVIVMLGIGSDISATAGWRARELHLPFGWAAYLAPLLGVAVYAVVGLLFSRTRLGRVAWAFGYAAGGLLISTPNLIETRYAQPISLSRWLEQDEKAALSASFPHPFVEYSASSVGIRLLIRRSDFDPSLLQFLRSIHALPDA